MAITIDRDEVTRLAKLHDVASTLLDPSDDAGYTPLVVVTTKAHTMTAKWDEYGHVIVDIENR